MYAILRSKVRKISRHGDLVHVVDDRNRNNYVSEMKIIIPSCNRAIYVSVPDNSVRYQKRSLDDDEQSYLRLYASDVAKELKLNVC